MVCEVRCEGCEVRGVRWCEVVYEGCEVRCVRWCVR